MSPVKYSILGIQIKIATMKQMITLAMVLFLSISSFAQVDELDIITKDNESMKLSEYLDAEKNHLIIFWASWCSICKNEKNRLSDYAEDWSTDYNTEVVSISTDVPSARSNAEALFASNDWPYQLIFSTSSDASSAFGISGVPYTFLINADHDILYSKRSFRTGDEVEIDEEIRSAFEATNSSEIELEEDWSFDVYRNHQGLEIAFDGILQDDAQAKVYTVDGRKIGQQNINSGTAMFYFELESVLNQSILVLELVTENGERKSKLIGL